MHPLHDRLLSLSVSLSQTAIGALPLSHPGSNSLKWKKEKKICKKQKKDEKEKNKGASLSLSPNMLTKVGAGGGGRFDMDKKNPYIG